MKAFIASVKEIFLNTISNPIWKNEKTLKIPLYQREYEWSTSNVTSLVREVLNRDKFLGMIILDEKEECYEIADGQQRLTTMLLSLISIYNHYQGSRKEQSVLNNYIFDKEMNIRLQNDSVGSYISSDNGSGLLEVDMIRMYIIKKMSLKQRMLRLMLFYRKMIGLKSLKTNFKTVRY